jgi:hypothetical protein
VQAPASGRHRRPFWVFVVVGIAVASVVFVGLGPPGWFLHATVCEVGSAVGNFVILSPGPLVNLPDGGGVNFAANYGSWNYSFTSGSLTMGSVPIPPQGAGVGEYASPPQAGIFADYADFNWTFYHAINVTKVGSASDPCTQPYVAVRGFPAINCESPFTTIPLANNSTDALEPHAWNGTTGQYNFEGTQCGLRTPGTYVSFDSSFHSNGTGVVGPVHWDLCRVTGFHPLELDGLAQLPVTVVVPFAGGHIAATGYLEWISNPLPGAHPPTVGYQVPGGWNWTLAPVGPAGSPINPDTPLPSLVAFVRSAC